MTGMPVRHRTLSGTQIQGYVPQEFNGNNESGFVALNDLVVVMVDVVEEKIGSIIVPQMQQEVYTVGATEGTIVAVGDGAFKWSADRNREWTGRKPGVGDRVSFERYGGADKTGKDGKSYRIMSDRAIACLLE